MGCGTRWELSSEDIAESTWTDRPGGESVRNHDVVSYGIRGITQDAVQSTSGPQSMDAKAQQTDRIGMALMLAVFVGATFEILFIEVRGNVAR